MFTPTLLLKGNCLTMQRSTARLLDEYLVASARSGSREAMEKLARRWHPRLAAHALRLTGDRDLAMDAAQAAWGAIMKGIARLEEPRAFPAWAYRITTRACAGEIGQAVARRKLAQAWASEPRETSVEPEQPSQLGKLQAAIRQLPAGERAAISLHHFEDLRVA